MSPAPARVPALEAPVARVLPLLGLAHLDREFDYLVPEALSSSAQPGTRVRIRFAGRLVDGFLLERVNESDHAGTLAWLERVVSPEVVLRPETMRLASAVAQRWVGVRSDVLRLAIPPRHAAAEKAVPPAKAMPDQPMLGPVPVPPGWTEWPMVVRFLQAAAVGGSPRAVWTVPPGNDWPTSLATLADSVRRQGKQVLVIVPDQRDISRVEAACREWVADRADVVALSAELGPSARYRRWLCAVRGHARIVVGTRSAVFTPLLEPGLIILHDDGDDSYIEPRAPYFHTREVAIIRSRLDGIPLLLSSLDRTPEVAALVASGWAPEIKPGQEVYRSQAPRVVAISEDDPRQQREAAGARSRLPAVAVAMARSALARDHPVLVQVPRLGYIPTLLCGHCRQPARCRQCNGPLRANRMDSVHGPVDLSCGWCGAPEARYRCGACGSTALRAGVTGVGRTAEELGRMFPGIRIRNSVGASSLERIEPGPAVVVCTPGAEPVADEGYGCALLLDAWALLVRPDLRSVQHALRKWIGAASLVVSADDGGQVFLSAEAALPVAQALIRWDPAGWAERELTDRAEVGFPPAVHMFAIDGAAEALTEVLEELGALDGAEFLGPVDLPDGVSLPGHDSYLNPERLLIRVAPSAVSATASTLRALMVARGSRRSALPIRIQLDPAIIG